MSKKYTFSISMEKVFVRGGVQVSVLLLPAWEVVTVLGAKQFGDRQPVSRRKTETPPSSDWAGFLVDVGHDGGINLLGGVRPRGRRP
ncbi:hypothetical protein [Halomonas sp.]|uniref:hypothetical protein n=1 Tax=Halomonas sp. TaxID=1486246 RepID=UPI00298DCB41|nr:hypothetical protein [Halomonas sp.]MDW7746188.1 hypothetical protein [Halomonas sp.]